METTSLLPAYYRIYPEDQVAGVAEGTGVAQVAGGHDFNIPNTQVGAHYSPKKGAETSHRTPTKIHGKGSFWSCTVIL